MLEAIRFLGAEKPIARLDLQGKEDVAVLATVARISMRIGRALARDIGAAPSGTDGYEAEGEAEVAEWLEHVRPEDFR